jgi:hypothetical protein
MKIIQAVGYNQMLKNLKTPAKDYDLVARDHTLSLELMITAH